MEQPHPQREYVALEEYGRLLQPHIEVSNGKLALLDANPQEYAGQSLNIHHVEGDPKDAGTIKALAGVADKRFPEYYERFCTRNEEGIAYCKEQLKSGGNVLIITNHGQLVDIAIALAGSYASLLEAGYKPSTGIIISKIVSRAGYRLHPDYPPPPLP